MAEKIDIRVLATLARLEVSDAEVKKLEAELPSILAFVETIQKADAPAKGTTSDLHNVVREDAGAHEGGVYSERLLNAAPAREGDRIAVKQVISRKSKEV